MPFSHYVLEVLQKEWHKSQPLLPLYFHMLISALIPIFAGAHASLARPSSAAKPSKTRKKVGPKDFTEDDLQEDTESKIEGLSASAAIWFPIAAGCTLGGLYFILKWLEDPALLSAVINGYFGIVGGLGVVQMFKDSLDVAVSYVFPSKYLYHGQIWKFDCINQKAVSEKDRCQTWRSPLPGRLSRLPLPSFVQRFIWALRSSKSTLCIRTTVGPLSKAHIHITPTAVLGFAIALPILLYYNFIARPWYLTNVLGFAFAYSSLQLISPTTPSVGTMVLGALLLYDVYFVFFTPMMVAVAKQLDVPAKLVFPRPTDPAKPSEKQLAMLGLGDVALPGMMIGFALRLDLYLHYLKKQMHKPIVKADKLEGEGQNSSVEAAHESKPLSEEESESSPSKDAPNEPSSPLVIKPSFNRATGQWGTRFWTSSLDPSVRGAIFPKSYFTASMIGYVMGLVITLVVSQALNRPQPALLYLVPCVLLSFWGTAVVKGEVQKVWNFDESAESKEEEEAKQDEVAKKQGKEVADDEKKAVAEWIERHRLTTDFFSLDVQLGWTSSNGTKECARRLPGRSSRRDNVSHRG
ncbi:MAG: hypothetical protein LQ352_007351 [Teloschistes flavicans]|nr:MAG: hypothetical protein LQ352_007351 [Teloschistes flavicans]